MPSTPRPPEGRARTVLTAEERSRRARAAALTRHHPDSEAGIAEQQALRAAAAERYVKQLVAMWPPLSAEQRNRLAVLLAVPDHQDGQDGNGAPIVYADHYAPLVRTLAAHPGATYSDLMELLGWRPNRVRSALRRLVAGGRVVGDRRGHTGGKPVHYRLAPEPEGGGGHA